MASYRKIKSGWTARIRVTGHAEEFECAFRTKADAKKWAEPIEERLRGVNSIRGLGPNKTTLAVALRDYAYDEISKQAGCVQALCKVNKYLRAAGLAPLKATKTRGGRVFGTGSDGLPSALDQKVEAPLFELTEHAPKEVFQGPRQTGFAARQEENLKMGARAQAYREYLARAKVSEIQAFHLTKLVDLMSADGYSPATQRQEVAILSAFFSHAIRKWNWPLAKNPVLQFDWPVGAERDRVMSAEESQRMAGSLTKCRNLVFVRFVLFALEAAMRKGEAISTARWCDVDTEHNVLNLPHAKAGRREVPLSPEALSLLDQMPRGGPTDRIFPLSESAVNCAWKRLCQDAQIENLHIHDLRATSATMWAELLNGDILSLQQITGHRTLKMLQRYVRSSARKVAARLQQVRQPTIAANVRQALELSSGASQAPGATSEIGNIAVDALSQATPNSSTACDVDQPGAADGCETEVLPDQDDNVVSFAAHALRRKAQATQNATSSMR